MDISKEELGALIEAAVSRAARSHYCVFTLEEKQTLKDIALGGRAFKRIIIYLLVGFLLIGIGIKNLPDVIKAIKG